MRFDTQSMPAHCLTRNLALRSSLMEMWEEQWQEEVIRGPVSSPVSARCPASVSWPLSIEQPLG